MSVIHTPGIFLTPVYDDMVKFVNSGSKYVNNKGILIDIGKSSHLQSLEYNHNYTVGAIPILTLKFVDVDGNFESKFINTDVGRELLDKLYEKTKQNENSKQSHLITNVIQSTYRIYCTFGIGDQLKNWCNPFSVDLFDAKITITTNNLRIYEFSFQASVAEFFQIPLRLDSMHPNMYGELNFDNCNVRTNVFIPVRLGNMLDAHSNIKKLLQLFISKVTGNQLENTVVILPKLNEYFNKYLDEKIKSMSEPTPQNSTKFFEILNALYKVFGVDVIIRDEKSEHIFNVIDSKIFADSSDIPQCSQEVVIESQEQGDLKPKFLLVMSTSTYDYDQDRKKINIPDWWKKLDEVQSGYKAVKQYDSGKMSAYQENNFKILKVLKDNWLIQNEKSPCVLVGPSLFVDQLVYCNRLSEDSTIDTEPSDFIANKLNSKNYRLSFIKSINKNKSNSSFDEELIEDELVYNFPTNTNTLESNNLGYKLKELKEMDIPIFLNNVKNGNVIGITFDTAMTYMQNINAAVQDDRRRYFYHKIDEKQKQLFRYTSKLNSDEMDFIQRVYSKFQQYNKDIVTKESESLNEPPITYSVGNPQTGISESLKSNYTYLEFFDLFPAPGNTKLMYELYKNLSVAKLNGFFKSIGQSDLKNLVTEFIAFNEVNRVSDPTIELTSQILGANSKSLQSSIYSYMFKNAIRVSLKTLPFFHLAGQNVINKPAYIISHKIKSISSQSTSNEYDPFSGLYRIIGYRHFISSKELFSEFKFDKKIGNGSDILTLQNLIGGGSNDSNTSLTQPTETESTPVSYSQPNNFGGEVSVTDTVNQERMLYSTDQARAIIARDDAAQEEFEERMDRKAQAAQEAKARASGFIARPIPKDPSGFVRRSE